MFKFLHAADIHLDSPLLRLDAYEGAPVGGDPRRHAAGVRESRADGAGGEGRLRRASPGTSTTATGRTTTPGLHFVSRIARLREAGIPVFLAAGNHDAASSITRSLRLPDNVHVFPHDRPTTVRTRAR